MTEQEWLSCQEPREMLSLVQEQASDRKLILYSLACWTTADYYSEPDWAEAITELTDSVLSGKVHLVRLICLFGAFSFDTPPTPNRWALMATLEQQSTDSAKALQVRFLRDSFGNPFRPIAFSAEWLTSTVLALTTGIYAERAFDRMPILADALQDAGCVNEDILNHCRGPGAHVRGCWVVDAILGKA